jgi:hypothetical protein
MHDRPVVMLIKTPSRAVTPDGRCSLVPVAWLLRKLHDPYLVVVGWRQPSFRCRVPSVCQLHLQRKP